MTSVSNSRARGVGWAARVSHRRREKAAPVPLLRHVSQVRGRPRLAAVGGDVHPYDALAAAGPGVARVP